MRHIAETGASIMYVNFGLAETLRSSRPESHIRTALSVLAVTKNVWSADVTISTIPPVCCVRCAINVMGDAVLFLVRGRFRCPAEIRGPKSRSGSRYVCRSICSRNALTPGSWPS